MTWRELVLGKLTQGFSSVTAWTSYLFSPNPGSVPPALTRALGGLKGSYANLCLGHGEVWWLQVGSLEGQPDHERFIW